MANYIRSHFCVEHSIQEIEFYQLLQELDRLDCKYNVWERGKVAGYLEPGEQPLEVKERVLDVQTCLSKLQQLAAWLTTAGFMKIAFSWQIGDQRFFARLMKWKYAPNVGTRISFDVDDAVFLKQSIEFTPSVEHFAYGKFKQIIGAIVRQIRPFVGAIDEEADLFCDTLSQPGSVVSWGNFFSHAFLKQWSESELQVLRQTVDEYIQIDSLGVLTFIHPLAANQAWGARHKKIDAILQHNRLERL